MFNGPSLYVLVSILSNTASISYLPDSCSRSRKLWRPLSSTLQQPLHNGSLTLFLWLFLNDSNWELFQISSTDALSSNFHKPSRTAHGDTLPEGSSINWTNGAMHWYFLQGMTFITKFRPFFNGTINFLSHHFVYSCSKVFVIASMV